MRTILIDTDLGSDIDDALALRLALRLRDGEGVGLLTWKEVWNQSAKGNGASKVTFLPHLGQAPFHSWRLLPPHFGQSISARGSPSLSSSTTTVSTARQAEQ